jgi:hypothetical protein
MSVSICTTGIFATPRAEATWAARALESEASIKVNECLLAPGAVAVDDLLYDVVAGLKDPALVLVQCHDASQLRPHALVSVSSHALLQELLSCANVNCERSWVVTEPQRQIHITVLAGITTKLTCSAAHRAMNFRVAGGDQAKVSCGLLLHMPGQAAVA